jgi:hypothetical protein
MTETELRELILRYSDLVAVHDRYRDALLRISNEDYRGPEPWSRREARAALFPDEEAS